MKDANSLIIDEAQGGDTMRVAQYTRMSTEHQRYSTENQAQLIAEYAAAHRMQIVRTYQDDGKSGLNIAGREGLRRLLRDVQGGATDFSAVLVTSTSSSAKIDSWCRWQGRRRAFSFLGGQSECAGGKLILDRQCDPQWRTAGREPWRAGQLLHGPLSPSVK